MQQFKPNRIALMLAATIGGAFVQPLASYAQDNRTRVLEEVVISAQKVQESLQDAPIAVTAFSSDKLEALGVFSANEVAHYTPNMFGESQPGSSSTTNFTIRGITTTDPTLSVEAGVGVYMNGIYIARSNGLIFDVVDLERIEVLRGPQGTLYGRNTTGGAINVITERPKGEFGFKQLITAGNRSRLRSQTTIDTPEWKGLSAKLSYMHNEQDGYVKNDTTLFQQGKAGDFGERNDDAFNIALRWDVSENFTVDYNYDRTDSTTVPQASQLSWASSDAARLVTDFGGFFFPGCYDNSPLCGPIKSAYEAAEASASSERVKRLNMPYAGEENTEVYGHALTLTWEISDQLTLKSLTGYRDMEVQQRTDLSGGGFTTNPGLVTGGIDTLFAAGAPNIKEQDQFSQEFQLIGNWDKFDYVGGLYYFEEDGNENTVEMVAFNLGFWGPEKRYSVHNESWAVFGQGTYNFSDDLRLTLGLRYSKDQKELFQDQAPDPFVPENRIQANFDDEFSNTSGNITLDYDWSEELSTYLRYATGYKAGGYFSRAPIAFQQPFDEETLKSIEFGLKSQWLDNRLRANLAVFYSEYDDLQISQFVPGTGGAVSVLNNAGKANYTGAELEIVAIPMTGLTLNLSYGWLDPEYDEYDFFDPSGQICGAPGTTCDVTDRGIFATTPESTVALGAQYEFAPFSFGALSARVDVTYNDGYTFGTIEISEPERIESSDHTLVNARIMLDQIGLVQTGSLRLALWGKNLTDEEYRTYSIGNFEALGFTTVIYNEPLSWGLDVIYDY